MKKVILILLVLIALFYYLGWDDSENITQNNISNTTETIWENNNTWTSNNTTSTENIPTEEEKKSTVEITDLTDNKFLNFDDVDLESLATLKTGEIEITWNIIEGTKVDKIIVDFVNHDSDFKEDHYQLQTFKLWDTTFKYRASSRYQVLDFWKNIYTFKAYSGDETAETQVVINLVDNAGNNELDSEEALEKLINDENLVWADIENIEGNLPTSIEYWSPSVSWDTITYPSIEWLKIYSKWVPTMSCWNSDLVSKLIEKETSSRYYWNTCRDIVKDKGISVYVIRLDWDNYIYEKHYIDYTNWLYGVLELAVGTDVTKDNIEEKNNELKEINSTFEKTTEVDKLFRTISDNM